MDYQLWFAVGWCKKQRYRRMGDDIQITYARVIRLRDYRYHPLYTHTLLKIDIKKSTETPSRQEKIDSTEHSDLRHLCDVYSIYKQILYVRVVQNDKRVNEPRNANYTTAEEVDGELQVRTTVMLWMDAVVYWILYRSRLLLLLTI